MWGWLRRARQFVNRAVNRILGRDAMRTLGAANVAAMEGGALGLTDQLVADQLTVGQWQAAMRAQIKSAYIQQYTLGIGGVDRLTQADYGSIGGMLAEQYRYLDNFAAEIAAGELTPEQIRARSAMYLRSSREAYERANSRAWGVPPLPAYPGDGQTRCLTNCQCSWVIEEVVDEEGAMAGWDCFWTLGVAEHCEDCVENSHKWNPLFVSR
jgi:hypothetical protein